MKKVSFYGILFGITPWLFTYFAYKLLFVIEELKRGNFTGFLNILFMMFLMGILFGFGILLMLWLEKSICRQSEKGPWICLAGVLVIPAVYLAAYGLRIPSLVFFLFSQTLITYTFGTYFTIFFVRNLYQLIQNGRFRKEKESGN